MSTHEPQPGEPQEASVEMLAARVKQLTDTLEAVRPKAEAAVPRGELRRRLAGAAVVVVLLLAALVVTGITTLKASQGDLSQQVLTCFLRPGQVTQAVAQACDRRFSPEGHEYLQLQQRSRAATSDFADLREWAKARGWQPPSEEPDR